MEFDLRCARHALAALVSDSPLAQRLHKALECLGPLRSLHDYDTTIIEMLSDAQNENLTLKEKAKAVADLIEAVFRVCDLRWIQREVRSR
jgi:hypothetical protein